MNFSDGRDVVAREVSACLKRSRDVLDLVPLPSGQGFCPRAKTFEGRLDIVGREFQCG